MVDILLATYNGEKYIRAQVLSLLYQSYSDIRVIVHDDGSTDKTVEILRKLASIDKRVFLVEDGVILGSAAKNFMHVLKFSKADVVMFCDQDDIWFDNKVAKMLDVFTKKDESIPQVLFSNSYTWHPDTGIEGLKTTVKPRNLINFLFMNAGVQGCVAMFNKAMRELMLKWQGELAMHDDVLCLLGVTLGRLDYMAEPLMLYRRHPDAVTGNFKTKASVWSCLYTNRKAPVIEARHYATVGQFLEVYEDMLGEKEKTTIRRYLEMKDLSFMERIFSVIRNRFQIRDSVILLLVKLILRPYFKQLPIEGGENLDLERNFFETNLEFEVVA